MASRSYILLSRSGWTNNVIVTSKNAYEKILKEFNFYQFSEYQDRFVWVKRQHKGFLKRFWKDKFKSDEDNFLVNLDMF